MLKELICIYSGGTLITACILFNIKVHEGKAIHTCLVG